MREAIGFIAAFIVLIVSVPAAIPVSTHYYKRWDSYWSRPDFQTIVYTNSYGMQRSAAGRWEGNYIFLSGELCK